jgi:hypothetical protein
MPFPIFNGNRPGNVRKSAKYQIRSRAGSHVVAIVYEAAEGERWYPSTDQHPELVKMVNNVKTTHGSAPGGSFYINEYHQVIVPVIGAGQDYYLGGEYRRPLRFEFEEKVISGEPVDFEGRPLSPGSVWIGPHAGIPYTLAAGGNDIYFTFSPRPNVEKKVCLSSQIGREAAREASEPIRSVKGSSGGRFYVNEFLSIFAPINSRYGIDYLYAGQIDLSKWFGRPNASG